MLGLGGYALGTLLENGREMRWTLHRCESAGLMNAARVEDDCIERLSAEPATAAAIVLVCAIADDRKQDVYSTNAAQNSWYDCGLG